MKTLNIWIMCLLLSGLCFADTPKQFASFSASMVLVHPNGNEKPGMYLYYTHDKLRLEMVESPMDSGSMVTLYLRDQKKIVTLLPEKKVYFENELTDLEMFRTFGFNPKIKKEESIGKENIANCECIKKIIETETTVKGEKKIVKSTIWVSADFEFPVKVTDEYGFSREFRHIFKADQPAEKFKIPEGFKKVKDFSEAISR